MRPYPVATAGALLGLVLILSACGEDRPAPAAGASAAQRGVEADSGGKGGDGTCRQRLRPFLSSMDALREDLAVGLSYEEYLDELGEARAAYAGIRANRVPVDCLIAAGAPGERALNRYIEAANAWGDCLATASCETGSIEPQLQRRWAAASDLLSAARAGL